MQRETSDIIQQIRSHTDQAENQRRILEEKMKKDRNNKIHTEVITSHKKNVEIDWTWQELEEKEDCEELAKVSFFIILTYFFQIIGHRGSKRRMQIDYLPKGVVD